MIISCSLFDLVVSFQCILIPCFATSFEKNEGERLIGGPPAPDQDNPDNIISIFINKVPSPYPQKLVALLNFDYFF